MFSFFSISKCFNFFLIVKVFFYFSIFSNFLPLKKNYVLFFFFFVTPSGDYSTAIENSSWINAHTSDPSSKANVVGWWYIYDERPDQPGGWDPTPSRLSPHNVECKKIEGQYATGFQ
jgi:hypothetical protein